MAKLNANERFEIKARAFEKMRGMLAPGKDAGIICGGDLRKVREDEWYSWCDKYDVVIRHMLDAFEEIM